PEDRLRALDAERRHEIILLDAVTRHADPADEHALAVQGRAAGEEDDAALVRGGRREAHLVEARRLAVFERERIERTFEARRVDARRKMRLREEPERAARDRRAGRNDAR